MLLDEVERLREALERITKLSPSAEYAASNAMFTARRALEDVRSPIRSYPEPLDEYEAFGPVFP